MGVVISGYVLTEEIKKNTAWLCEQQDIIAARMAYLFREMGIDVRSLICVKIFPSIQDPTGGVFITPRGEVYQFGFNRIGMIIESARIDEWVNITQSYMQHPWRDEILAGLAYINNNLKPPPPPG